MIRNWWLEAKIDGRKTVLAGGPQAKDGGFTLFVYQRSGGKIVQAVRLIGKAKDGQLCLAVSPLWKSSWPDVFVSES